MRILAAVLVAIASGLAPAQDDPKLETGTQQKAPTAFAASSAAFLQDRFGWKYGVPAYVMVGYVSYVRVATNHHRWRDIAAGVALSMGVSRLFVTPHDATHMAPIVGPDWLGMRIERSF